ncbi:hypothetical protein, partial [uncultured Alistipes sp.]|uniref:hypothetical protein n=1 Tax=uncultured Alistipes sp. TaxID=538949 RepID=UPI002676B081
MVAQSYKNAAKNGKIEAEKSAEPATNKLCPAEPSAAKRCGVSQTRHPEEDPAAQKKQSAVNQQIEKVPGAGVEPARHCCHWCLR